MTQTTVCDQQGIWEVLAAPLLIQLPEESTGKVAETGPRAWALPSMGETLVELLALACTQTWLL